MRAITCRSILLAGAAALAGGVALPAHALMPDPEDGTAAAPVVPAPEERTTGRIIVKYRDGAAPGAFGSRGAARQTADALGEALGAPVEVVRPLSGGAQLVEIQDIGLLADDGAAPDIEAIAARIAARPEVEYAEPDSVMTIQQAADDPRLPEQWHYTAPGTGVDAPGGWDEGTGSGVTVAVIDTGARPHADLAANLLPGYDFISSPQVANDGGGRDPDASDPGDWLTPAEAAACSTTPRNSSWHGTHVAGTVAAVTDNATGVAGVARGARIVPVRVLGKCGGALSDIVDAIRWSAGLTVPGAPANPNPAEIINLSLGGSGACGGAYQDAFDDAIAAGATVVVAAGNSDADAAGFRPANCDGVITVAATNRTGKRSYYSNFGAAVEIAAPGGETFVQSDGVLSTANAGATTPGADSYLFYQGTSMAAPHVAGVAAILKSVAPSASPAQILSAMESTAQPFPPGGTRPCSTTTCGAGIVDAGEAARSLAPTGAVVASMGWLPLLLGN